jgi:hypothetical protein
MVRIGGIEVGRAALLACDFLETVTVKGPGYVLAVIEHASRRIWILARPPGGW